MKKNKRIKTLLIIAIICFIGGGVLIGAGFASGGSTSYLSMKLNDSISLFDIGFFTNSNQESDERNLQSWTQELSDKRKLEIYSSRGDVEVRKGNKTEVQFQNLNKDYVTVKEENDKIVISVSYPDLWQHQAIFESESRNIIVILSEKDYDLEIENNLGDIEVSDLIFQELSITSHLGDITLDQVETQDCDIEQNSGDIHATGSFYQDMDIQNNLGDVTVNIKGNIEDYDYELTSNLGDIRIGNLSKNMNGTMKFKQGRKNVIQIEDNLGDIQVDFY